MRVLHVIPSLASQTGGPAFAVVESARSLRQLGVESEIVATDLPAAANAGARRAVTAAELPSGIGNLDVRLFRARPPRRLAFSPGLARRVAAAAGEVDLVHVHSLYLFPQLAAFVAARRHRVPYLVSLHGSLDPWLRARGRSRKALVDRAWQRRMLEHAAALHVTTAEEERLTADVAPAVPRSVVPYGIDWAGFQMLPPPEEFRRRYLNGWQGPVVLNVGRIAAKKGLDVLVRAVAGLPDAHLVLAGPDDEGLRASLAQLAFSLGARDRVTFTGMLHRDERLGALAAGDVWALPSHTENFGIAVVEAMAAARPVVVSPGVNLAPDVAAARAGLVVAAEPEALTRALSALLGDPERRQGLAARAREFARQYDWSEVAPRWRSMYMEATRR
jgi:glycosyltransferase involved in cell wall biosynthesis